LQAQVRDIIVQADTPPVPEPMPEPMPAAHMPDTMPLSSGPLQAGGRVGMPVPVSEGVPMPPLLP